MAEQLLPPSVYNIFLLSLGLHVYSPAVQTFYQVRERATNIAELSHCDSLMQLSTESLATVNIPQDCYAFVDIYGSIACNLQDLHQLLAADINNAR